MANTNFNIKPLFFIALLLCAISVHGQTITVLNKQNNTPAVGVAIFNKEKTTSVITDIYGKANISKFFKSEVITFKSIAFTTKHALKASLLHTNKIVYLKPVVEDLSQIVISASRFKQSKTDIPKRIRSINADDIAIANPQTSADLLQNTGNVFVQKSQLGGGSPMIRGFSTNRLLLTIDGVRMNNAIFRSGNVQNVISIDPLAIQHTEVTLGAGSVVYGSDAIGGVMSFYTKKPQLSYKDSVYFKANAMTRYASANTEKTAHLDVNLGYKKWALLSSFSYSDFDDLRMGSFGPTAYLRPQFVTTQDGEDILVSNTNPKLQVPTGFSQLSLMQKVRFEPKNNLSFNFGLHYSTTSNYPRYDRLIRPSDVGLRSAEWAYGPQQWIMANLGLTKLSSNSPYYDKIQAVVAIQNFKESRIDRNFNSEQKRNRQEDLNAVSFNVDLEKKINTKTSLFYGAEYLHNTVKSSAKQTNILNETSQPAVTRYPNNSKWQSAAIYTSLKYKPSTKFVFQTGIRYNYVNTQANFSQNNEFLNLPFENSTLNSGAFTGTAGLRYSPSTLLEWNVNFATAFRAPNIDDVGKVFDSEPGAVVVPNNNLKPEYAYNGELGVQLNITNDFQINATTYYTFLDDALIRRNYTLNGETQIVYDGEISTVQAIQNASEEHIYGVELGAELKFNSSLKLTSFYNVVSGFERVNNTQRPVRHVSPNFGRTHLFFKKNKLTLDGFLEYNDELSNNQLAISELSKDYIYAPDANGNPYAPSWYTLNFRAQYKLNNHIQFTASLENITDQRYRPYSSGISAPGRNFIASVNYKI